MEVTLMTNNKFDAQLVQQFLSEYQDRGMLKWQGFYLSDHTSKLKQMAQQQKTQEQQQHLPQMTTAAIVQVIQQAYQKNLPVQIDLAQRDVEGYISAPICGQIRGYYADQLVVGSQNYLINLQDIYAIQIAAS